MRCQNCQNQLPDLKVPAWLRLVNFLDFLRLQDQITDETYDSLLDDLSWFKEFAYSDESEIEHKVK